MLIQQEQLDTRTKLLPELSLNDIILSRKKGWPFTLELTNLSGMIRESITQRVDEDPLVWSAPEDKHHYLLPTKQIQKVEIQARVSTATPLTTFI